MKQLIEDLISAMEYHVEQTRPVHMTTVAIQAAREALKAMPAAQPAPWVGLTLEEHVEIMRRTTIPSRAAAIEAKLKEKNRG
jgi:hypothetical protein